MQEESTQKLYLPGDEVGKLLEFSEGEGTYSKDNKIYASQAGYLQIQQNENSQILHIKNSKISPIQIKVGSLIYGKVLRIKEDRILVKIIQVDGVITKQYLEGIIRKQNIRLQEIDKLLIENTFLPDDIVKASVISYGDSKQIYLSTAQNDLGVVFARNLESKQLMIPYNWEEFICPATGIKEKRKVAKPDFSQFNVK